MFYRFMVFFVLVLLSCEKKIHYPKTKIIGHAGAGLTALNTVYTDNSKKSIEMALETSGCDGVEIDLQLSASGKIWLFHDPFLDERTNASGCIGTKSDEDLKNIHYTSLHKEKLLAFSEMDFERCKGKTLLLDLRNYNYCNKASVDFQKFSDELANHPQLNDTHIEVFVLLNNPDWLVYLETLPFSLIYCPADMDDALSALEVYPCDGIMIRNAKITASQVSALKSEGKKVIIFEVRSPKGIKSAFKKEPDYLVTDDLRATIIEKY